MKVLARTYFKVMPTDPVLFSSYITLYLKIPAQSPLLDHQDASNSVCGVIPQFLGYNDNLRHLTYQVWHYAPVADAFAIGGTMGPTSYFTE